MGNTSLTFPPGIFEQMDIDQVSRFVKLNEDLSICEKPKIKEEFVKKEPKKTNNKKKHHKEITTPKTESDEKESSEKVIEDTPLSSEE